MEVPSPAAGPVKEMRVKRSATKSMPKPNWTLETGSSGPPSHHHGASSAPSGAAPMQTPHLGGSDVE